MAVTPDELFEKLDQFGIKVETHHHKPVFTVEDAQTVSRTLAGGHSKNLFLKDKNGDLYLLVCLENTKVNLKALKKQIGAKNLSFGKPELLEEVLGVTPGSVTPFALINDTEHRVKVLLDSLMMEEEFLNFHPLINDKTTQISQEGLKSFIEQTGHEAQILTLDSGE
ncbi:prolyl-tRNA synthetase associated domain-containing protein [Sneathiella sp. P13V-1]|uniref:prolyl-tRNA synthetase associated domain-containing protein n=1 Tax=Sneathiella sp. P13V-1 TaxID=2697366 RepID=UPI00187B6CBF|nr:prolyl-tRNA synthetase associated domain-containing protein [Sneathiella sp. P13V-1]MBE7636214.1 prolyl-tRNA synthetase associated domain-containing protein [Sneathiella sp. P13V-1]